MAMGSMGTPHPQERTLNNNFLPPGGVGGVFPVPLSAEEVNNERWWRWSRWWCGVLGGGGGRVGYPQQEYKFCDIYG